MSKLTDQFLMHYVQSDQGARSFDSHETLVRTLFGSASDFVELAIDDSNFKKLSAYLSSLHPVKNEDYIDLVQTVAQEDPLFKIIYSPRKGIN